MGRQLVVNGEVLDIARDNLTVSQLKEQLRSKGNTWVIIRDVHGLQHLGDEEIIPTNVHNVSIVPAYEYGGQE